MKTTEQTQSTSQSEMSVLEKLRAEWVKNGKPNPTKKQMDELSKSLVNAKAMRSKAEAELKKAEEHISLVYMELAKAVGARSIKLDGVLYNFSSRGEKVFLKAVTTDENVVSL